MTLPISIEQASALCGTNGKSLRVLMALKALLDGKQSNQTHAIHYSALRSLTKLSSTDIASAIADLVKYKVLIDDGIEFHSWAKRDAFTYKWNFVLVKD